MSSGKVGIHNEDREWIKVGVTNYSKDIRLTESYSRSSDGFIRRFTATICGFRNWKLYEGRMSPQVTGQEDVDTAQNTSIDAINSTKLNKTDLNATVNPHNTNASNITSGTVADTRLSSNISIKNITYYNVLDFGAVGDEVHDDTAAIQVAINIAQANGRKGIVLFPPRPGTGYSATNLTVNYPITLLGSGYMSTRIYNRANTTALLNITFTTQLTGMRISGIGFLGTNDTSPKENCVLLENAALSEIKNSGFARCIKGLELAGLTTTSEISGNTFGSQNTYGLYDTSTGENRIFGNWVNENYQDGFYINSPNNIISGNILQGNDLDGVSGDYDILLDTAAVNNTVAANRVLFEIGHSYSPISIRGNDNLISNNFFDHRFSGAATKPQIEAGATNNFLYLNDVTTAGFNDQGTGTKYIHYNGTCIVSSNNGACI